MTKNQGLAYTAGIWCFIVTAACCILGIYSPDPFTLFLNIITPIILIVLGLILPAIKKREDGTNPLMKQLQMSDMIVISLIFST